MLKKLAFPSAFCREDRVYNREVAVLLCDRDLLLLVSPAAHAADTQL